jgi:hypothetical protein
LVQPFPPTPRRRAARLLGAPAAALLAALTVGAAPAAADSGCTLFAAPNGSDSAAGTEAAPFRSIQQLTRALGPGETGCLRAGEYGGRDVFLDQPGVTLTSYPGERATISAFLEVEESAPGASVRALRFDTAGNPNSVGTKIQADRTVFADNIVTKGGEGICLLVGSQNDAERVVIERNHIYACGPADSKFDHQIYLQGTRGAVVRWNILNDNAGGWGVHLYSDADGSVVEHNIIDGNKGGVIFAGDGQGNTSDGNTVRYNAITNSGPRYNIEGSWSGGPEGQGNTAHDNCVYSKGGGRAGVAPLFGFAARSNFTPAAEPYAGEWRLEPGSRCAEVVGDVRRTIATGTPAVTKPFAPPRVFLEQPRAGRPRRAVRLSGRVMGRAGGQARKVALQVLGPRGWRTRARLRTRGGRFAVLIRGSRKRGVRPARTVRVIRVHAARNARVVRVRAVVPGVARSRAVRVRVAR